MSENNKKVNIGCILAAVGVSISILLSGIFIIGILFFIATPTFLNAADKAKDGAVKANMYMAKSVVNSYISDEFYTPDDAINKAIKFLNDAGAQNDPADDAKSPHDPNFKAFSKTPNPGVVTLKVKDKMTIIITGYDKNTNVLEQLNVDIPK